MREMKDSGVPWIGAIPKGWRISKVSRHFDIQLGKMLQPDKHFENDSYQHYLCAANVGQNRLKLVSIKQMWINETEREQFSVNKGDLLVVEGGDVASCDILREKPFDLFIQNSLHRVRSKENNDVAFLRYLLMAAKESGHIELICNRATIAHFTKEKFASLPFLLIPSQEQQRIAHFLDSRCAEIDFILEKTLVSIEELKNLKKSVITEAVTKGIRGKRPMKNSGVQWIGEIPEEWRIEPLWGTIRRKTEVEHPDEVVLSLYRDYGVIPKDSRDDNHNVTSLDTSNYKFVEVGDLVVNKMKAWQGSMAISSYQGIVSPAYHVCEIHNTNIYRPFLHYLLRNQIYLPEYLRLSTGMRVGQWDLSYDDLRHIPIVIPDIQEQQEIAAYLDEKCAAIDSLIASKEALLAELEAYNKSIIYEYVTGKKEVI